MKIKQIVEGIESSQGVAEGKIKLSTDPNWYGAEVGDYKAAGPVVNIPANRLVGFEPDDKMNQPASKANVEKIVAGLKQGAKLPPLLVRQYKNGYQVLDGHHRFWAYKLLGVKSIPAQVVPAGDIEEITKQGVTEGLLDDTYHKLKSMVLRVLGKKTGMSQNDTQSFQRMMSKVTAPVDSSQYARLWQEYKKDPNFYVSLPTLQDLQNSEKMYLWANSISQFVMNKFPDASKEALMQAVSGLTHYAVREFKNNNGRSVAEGRLRRPDAYERDVQSSVDMGGRNKEWDEGNTEPPNNFAIYINGKKWKVFPGEGTYAEDFSEKRQHQRLKELCAKKTATTGKKWSVSPTGEAPTP